MSSITCFILVLLFMLFIMIKTKINPFFVLLFGSLIIGLGCGLSVQDTISNITGGLGNTCKGLAIVIILGTVLGEYIEKSNGTQRIAKTLLGITGNKRASIALAITGFVVSIPVFADVALIMLAPLVKAIAERSKRTLGPLAAMLTFALLTTNSWVAPTAAPVATATALNLDLGISIIWGLLASVFVVFFAWLFCEFYLAKKKPEWWTISDTALPETSTQNISDNDMPGFLSSVFPILLPMILIILKTIAGSFLSEESVMYNIIMFIGDKNIALAVGIIASILCLHTHLSTKDIYDGLSHSLEVTGPVIFITAAGGALSQIIKSTAIGDMLAAFLSNCGLPVILVPFLITGLGKFAHGSGSVAVVMGAAMSLPLCEAGLIHPIVVFLAVCAGSQFGSHVNNSFFWVFANLFGYDTTTTLKSLCVGQHILAFAGLLFAWIVSVFLH